MMKRRMVDQIENTLDRRLSDQLKADLSARVRHKKNVKLLHEQQQVSEWLNAVADVEPPADLRAKILAAIPQVKQRRHMPLRQRILGGYCLQARRRIAFGAVIGSALGVLLTVIALYFAGRSDGMVRPWLTGTAVFSRQFEAVEAFDLPTVAGELSWKIGSPDCMVRIALRPNEPVRASLQFKRDEYQVSHFYQESWTGSGEVMVLSSSVLINLPTANRYVFVIKHRGETFSPMEFHLETTDSLLISKRLTVKEKI